MDTAGTLVLVATPIGNLGDISTRAATLLRNADALYCEDTRHSRQLLTHLEIRGQKLVSLHEHNEAVRIKEVLVRLEAGQIVGLVSDAGMPIISDPGQRLVAAAAEAGHTVTAIPGPNAALMALAISGLPAERFHFEGFLPHKGRDRKDRIEAVANLTETTVLYEAPGRVLRTVSDLLAACGPHRPIAIARELTKLHEEVWRGTLEAAEQHLASTERRGEYTLVLGPSTDVPELITDDQITTAVTGQLALSASRKTAVDLVTRQLKVSRKRVYALALKLKDPNKK